MRDCKKLTDEALITGIQAKVGEERRTVADFLCMLGEIDERRLYAVEGYEALYLYVIALGYTEAEAFSRITVARLVRRFPWILDIYLAGKLSVTALKLLAPYMTADNAEDLAKKASGLKVREVERLVAGLTVRRPVSETPTPLALVETHCKHAEAPPAKPVKLDKTRFVTTETIEISFAAKAELASKIERAKALARSKGVSSTLGDLVEHLVDDYLKRYDPATKTARTTRKAPVKKSSADSRSRYVPKSVVSEVKSRDGYRCAYVSASGHRCSATAGLHLDHIVPFAKGGPSTVSSNLRYLCATHNQFFARQSFGSAHIDRSIGLALAARLTRRATSASAAQST